MESEKRYYWDTIYGISFNDGTTMGYAMDEDEIIDRLNALEAERDRYAKALETIELMDPDWTLGVDENMSRLQSIAGRALKGSDDE